MGELREGQRVLCLDELRGGCEFVEVSSIQASPCPDQFTRLILEDGSSFDVTDEHPIPVCDSSQGASLPKIVRAIDLKPQIHVLSTWKRVDVRIKEVSRAYRGQQETMFAVNSYHADRYKMLVTGAKSQHQLNIDPSMVAVGFANLGVRSLACRGSFLDIVDETQTVQTLRRSVSDPAFNRSIRRSRPAEGLDVDNLQIRAPPHQVISVQTSTCTSLHEVDVHVGTSGEEEEVRVPPVPALPSIGSAGHAQGSCRPCNFHQRYLNGQSWGPCRQGASCRFCHELHSKRKSRLKNAVQPVEIRGLPLVNFAPLCSEWETADSPRADA